MHIDRVERYSGLVRMKGHNRRGGAEMSEPSSPLTHWVMFAGAVLVIVVLYWAQAVFVPIALAALLSFVLSPPVSWLERWLGRVPAVLIVVTLVFVVLGLAGWGLARQMNNLADDLPRTASTSGRRLPTCAAPARAAPSRSCRRRSTTSRRTSRRPVRCRGNLHER